MASMDNMPEVDPAWSAVMGRGVPGIPGLHAAIFEPTVTQVLWCEPLESHRENPVFLKIFRHTDLPEAGACLAPRRLIYSHAERRFRLRRPVTVSPWP